MAPRSLLLAALIAVCPPALADSIPSRSAAAIEFSIRIPRILQARLIEGPSHLYLPHAAGEAEGALSYEVVSNLATYEMRLTVIDPHVEEVWLHGLGTPLRFGREGAAVAVPVRGAAERRQLRTLSYRVRFAAGTRPGPRTIPLSVSFSGS